MPLRAHSIFFGLKNTTYNTRNFVKSSPWLMLSCRMYMTISNSAKYSYPLPFYSMRYSEYTSGCSSFSSTIHWLSSGKESEKFLSYSELVSIPSSRDITSKILWSESEFFECFIWYFLWIYRERLYQSREKILVSFCSMH